MIGDRKASGASDGKLRRDLAYGVGGLLDSWGLSGFKNLAHQVLNIVLGVNPALIGTVMGLVRLWDAVSDPVAGTIIDNQRERRGRRPFIVAGAVLSGLTFPLCWWIPAGFGQYAQFAWMMATGVLFYTCFTIFNVSYHAFGYEIAPNYHEKARFFAVRTSIGTLTGLAVAWVFPLIQSGWFGAPRESVAIISGLIAVVIAIAGAMPGWLLPEPAGAGRQADHASKISMRTALRVALTSRDFMGVAMSASLATAGVNAVTVLGTYVNIYYVHAGEIKPAVFIGGVQFTVSTIFILLCTPFMSMLSRWLGKRNALIACLLLALVGSVSKWFFYTPSHPWLILGVVFFLGPANAGVRIFADAMISDVCAKEAADRGRHLEAVFGAVYTWMLKTGLALATLISGFLITGSGFDISNGPVQSTETLFWLRAAFSFFPLVALMLSCLLLLGYRLDRNMKGN